MRQLDDLLGPKVARPRDSLKPLDGHTETLLL